MKHLIVSLFAALFIAPTLYGQDDYTRSDDIGISFQLFDFKTAQLIRSTSLGAVLRDKKFGEIKTMTPGLGLHYFKGLKNHIDFAGNINISFLDYPFRDRPTGGSDKFLLQAEATANFKMVSDKYWFQPFIIGGFGGHRYDVYYGAYMPLGVGLNINFFDEGRLFINSTYR